MIQSQWVQAMLLQDQGQRLQEAAGFPAAAAAAAATAAVQGLGPVVEPMLVLAVEPEPGPVVGPAGLAQPVGTVPMHIHLLC